MRREERFAEAVLPHLDAAYNLARWLMRNPSDADDAMQDACERALKFVGGLRGDDGKVWFLKIVRNACYTRLNSLRKHDCGSEFDEELHSSPSVAIDPAALLERSRDTAALNRALEMLPAEFREAIVMRELEGLSYKEIAAVADVPIGTVMSRLARGRERLRDILVPTELKR